MKTKFYLMVSFFLIILLSLSACSSQQTKEDRSWLKVKERGKLVVATETGFAPFTFKTLVNGKDTIVGSDVDMVNEIAKELGVSVEYKEMSFDNVLATVQSGHADIGISGISITKERQKSFLFSKGYYTAKTKLIVLKNKLNTYTSFDDFADKDIASQKGSIQENIAKETFSKSNIVSLPQTSEMIVELKQDKVDGVLLEEPIAKAYVEKNPTLAISDMNLPSKDSDSYGILLPKDSKSLRNKINKSLEPMIKTGKIDQLIESAFKLSIDQ